VTPRLKARGLTLPDRGRKTIVRVRRGTLVTVKGESDMQECLHPDARAGSRPARTSWRSQFTGNVAASRSTVISIK
jgi:hypothetical protein